jgi:hypothetical protein
MMSDSYYDVAQVCINGHVVNSSARDYPDLNAPHCEKCGAKTITVCPACQTSIRGYYHVPGVLGVGGYTPPAFCYQCGTAFPWSATALQAAKELADELDSLNAEEREQLKQSLDQLVRTTPQTPVAEARFKRIMKKAGKEGVDAMRSVLTAILSETVRKTLFGPQL